MRAPRRPTTRRRAARACSTCGAASGTQELIDAFGLPRALFPEARPSGERIGALSAHAARELGLAPGTPVALGGGDTRCGLLGAGAVADGDVGLVAGTTAPLELVLAEPLVDARGPPAQRTPRGAGRWVLEATPARSARASPGSRACCTPTTRGPRSASPPRPRRAPMGSAAMLANVGALVANDRAPAFPVGSLSLSHMTGTQGRRARASLARSALEGMACAVRANLEQLARVSGRETRRIHLAGGLARSALFARILAGVTGAEVVRAAAPEASGARRRALRGRRRGRVRRAARGRARSGVRAGEIAEPAPPSASAYAQLYQGWSDAARRGRADHGADRDAPHVPGRDRGGAAHGPPRRGGAPAERARDGRVRRRVARAAARFADVEYASFRERMRLLTGPSLVKALEGREVFVTEVDVVDAKALEQLPKLRVVAACRGDAVNVDVAACTAFGIPVLYAPGRNADAVADLTLAFLLMLARRLPAATRSSPIPPSRPATSPRWARRSAACQGTSSGRRRSGWSGSARSGARWRGASRASARGCSSHDPFVSRGRGRARGRRAGRARRAAARERLRQPARGGHGRDARPDRRGSSSRA